MGYRHYEYVGADHAADQASIAADPATQEWWKLTDPCQEPLTDAGEGAWWAPMRQVWHLNDTDGQGGA
jgi:L-rhamnose mutarotase